MTLKERFVQFEEDYIKFEDVKVKLSNRPDLHAFILLDHLIPGTSDIVCAAEHDEFFLSIKPSKLNKVATDEQIRDLVRCGIRFDENTDCLCMFA